jgi:3-isopropylmalate dehydrogenase
MPFRIAVIPGDGIGPEVIAQGIRILQAVTAATGTDLEFVTYDLGADRYLRTGEILPDSVFSELEQVDAIYLGAVGDPRVQNPQYAAGCCSACASSWTFGSTCGRPGCWRPG